MEEPDHVLELLVRDHAADEDDVRPLVVEFLRSTLARLGPHMRTGQIVVSATKGVENVTLLRMTQVIAENTAGVTEVRDHMCWIEPNSGFYVPTKEDRSEE